MDEQLKFRNEVDESLTWDLTLFYKDENEYKEQLDLMVSITNDIVTNYPGKLNNVSTINECLEKYRQVEEIINLITYYVRLAVEVDYYNTENQRQQAKAQAVMADVRAKLSFIKIELCQQSDDLLDECLKTSKNCGEFIKEVIRQKPHTLSAQTEKVLAAISPVTAAPNDIYNAIKFADIKFDNFEVDGKSYPLGYSLFEDYYEYHKDTKVRRAAFEAFSNKIKEYENSTAAVYNTYCQFEKEMADIRGFKSIFDKDLFKDKVTREMYDRQIDLIMEKLAPIMRKYATLRKEVFGLDKMTFADLKLPLDNDYCPSVTIEEARKFIVDGLSIMGEDYVSMINEAFDNRWIDFARNKGKSTGGFCLTSYQKPSFILFNWNEKMSDVFTLAHELGHAGHFKACNYAQSVFGVDISSYFIEAPSTMNEMFMSNYMLNQSNDKRFRRWVLSNMVGKTYYHNFVTHLLEAAYQREVYKIIDAGGSLQADTLNNIYKDVLTKFWGDAVEIPEGAYRTWMRQPHYYMGMFSYCYSAGLTIATQMVKRLQNEGKEAVEDWKKVLAAGSTMTPVELAALAKIDITTDAALLDTIETIGQYVDEICQLTDELNSKKNHK